MRRATLLVPLLLLAACSINLAQDRALISGDTEDKQDNPIIGAQVTLHNDSLRIDRTATTNSDGIYSFAEVVPAEDYVVSVSIPGMTFSPPAVKFEVQVGETRHLLPSFIGESPATPVSDIRRRGQSDEWFQAAFPQVAQQSFRAGAGLLPAGYRSSATSTRYVLLADTGMDSQSQPPGTQTPQATPPKGTGPQSSPPPAKSRKLPVESAHAPLDMLSTSVSTVVTSNQLRSLPLFNRNFLAVGLLVSSTHDVPAWSELKDTTFSISGQRPTSNAFLLDGMDNEATSSNQAIPFQVNDAIQEFRVTTANSDAQFGRNIGGVVNVITRRGTAKFHGSVFGFFATDSIDAGSPLSVYGGSGFEQAAAFAGSVNAAPASSTSPPGYVPLYEPNSYNQYVATVQALNSSHCTVPQPTTGVCNPVFDPAAILSHYDRHTQPLTSQQFGGQAGGSFLKRWYWFGDYEGTRINNPNPIFERVPSSYDRSHLTDFTPGTSGYQDAAFAQSVLALYPQSNVVAVPDVLEFYRGYAPNYTNVNNYLGRLDFTQSQNTDWTFRYNLQNLSQLHDDTLPSSSVYPGNGAQRAVLNQNLVLTFTHRFSDRLSNVIRGGFTQFRVTETPQDANFNASAAGLPAGSMRTYLLSGLDPQYAGSMPGVNGAWAGWYDSVWYPKSSVPLIAPSLDGLFPFTRLGAPLSAPGKRRDLEGELMDNLVWFAGKHTIRAGIDLRRLQNIFDNGGFSRGLVVSNDIGEFTSDSESCNTCASPAFTSPSFVYAMQQPSPYNTTFHSYVAAGYLQDTWRAKPNLTVNLGLRYEYFSAPSEVNNLIWNYDTSANGLVREGRNSVLDAWGDKCGSQKAINGAVYPALQTRLPWTCSPIGNGNFVVADAYNFEPRIGIAWSTPSGDTVIRAGFGIFFDEIPASLMAQLAFNRPSISTESNAQTIYGQNFIGGACGFGQCGMGNASLVSSSAYQPYYQAADVPFAVSAIDPANLKNPRTRQLNVSVARQINPSISAELSYIGNFMANLPTTSNTGFNNEWFCTTSAFGHTRQPCDPFSSGPVFTTANIGYGNYNALVARFTTRSWHGLQSRASYTYSKALDNGSSAGAPLIPGPLMSQTFNLGYYGPGSPLLYALGTTTSSYAPPPGVFSPGSISASFSALTGLLTAGVRTTGAGQVQVTPYLIPQSPYNFLRNDYGRSDYNQTNRFILEYTWDIPTSRRSIWLNGWLLSGVFIAESGQPFTIFSGPIAGELTQRVDLTGPLTMTGNPNGYIGNLNNIVLPGAVCATQSVANSPYVVQTTVGIKSGQSGTPCLGDSSRNQFTGPSYVDYDMAVQKTFKIREALALSLRAESYNLFNHPNYYNPISSYSLDGVTQYSQFGQTKSAHNARQFQFAARLNW